MGKPMKFILKFQGENKKLKTIINMKKNPTFQVHITFTILKYEFRQLHGFS